MKHVGKILKESPESDFSMIFSIISTANAAVVTAGEDERVYETKIVAIC